MNNDLTYNIWRDEWFVKNHNDDIYGEKDDADNGHGNKEVDVANNTEVTAVKVLVGNILAAPTSNCDERK